MNYFVQQLVNGVSLGAVYGLIALGYTMVYGILKFINFAHSDIVVQVALIWLAHIGMDRTLGFGLKYPTVFEDTHLQHV